jgi:hypothetical protein
VSSKGGRERAVCGDLDGGRVGDKGTTLAMRFSAAKPMMGHYSQYLCRVKSRSSSAGKKATLSKYLTFAKPQLSQWSPSLGVLRG